MFVIVPSLLRFVEEMNIYCRTGLILIYDPGSKKFRVLLLLLLLPLCVELILSALKSYKISVKFSSKRLSNWHF